MEIKKSSIQEAQTEQQSIEDEIDGLSRSREEFTGKMEELSGKASQLAMKLADIRVKSVTNESSLNEITLRLSQLTAGVALRTQQAAAAKAEAGECSESFQACCQKAEELQNSVKGYEMRYQSRLSRLEAAKQKADKLALDAEEKRRRVRLLEEMERSMEGFTQSVKTIMKQSERGMLKGIHGRCPVLSKPRPRPRSPSKPLWVQPPRTSSATPRRMPSGQSPISRITTPDARPFFPVVN